ncbi:DUF3392 domain-containing protein [Catenovulum sp. SM1970]|uniref:DUF3392 domain-containing protein n=1 Tax=Marinifaba aquimaris TaxID=2741323 RepID=UPI001574A928|nr:DUF3392 domain-containing protein [Marinifaba aquimaris]NTS77788.1 DUF3392 domain-containing protein [Marinifaba aquimaris]
MQAFLIKLSQFTRPYLDEVALAVVATLMVIYGDVINKHIRQMLKNLPFIVRAFLFIWICAFGYGAAIIFLTPFTTQLLSQIGNQYLFVALMGIFTTLGLLAERRRYM